MTREKQIERLKSIPLCVCNLTATYDMGLQIDVLTSQGVATSFGQFCQWPCLTFTVTKAIKDIQKALIAETTLPDSQILNNKAIRRMCVCDDMFNGSFELSGENLSQALNKIRKELPKVEFKDRNGYAYIEIGSDIFIKFFTSLADLQNHFLGNFDNYYEYNEMEDDELQHWYDVAEDNGWDNFPLTKI